MNDSAVCATLEISVPARPASLGEVRSLVRSFLAEHGLRDSERHGVVLVAHELAANAIVHGGTDDSEVVAITVVLEPRSVRIRVLGPARTEATPRSLEATDWRESGRGMLIVDQLATWTQRLRDGRREVAATLALPEVGDRAGGGSR